MVELSLTSPCKWGSCFCVSGGSVLYMQDQYMNHIINETGASVSLTGRGSEGQQQLHLLLSSTNLKSLENAKHLAEHLLDAISVEFDVSRMSSAKVYAAVPPP
ncbi:hypothetical protein MLD38_000223 [Melastoma candidum]|uniref:Uncharacterized protein n=1 Tax=Melastoma candidum TaxID=119954 RepID=A0ACB9S9I6_9MYRT|nr:hypothetical protein MLD38_000223 [Melastoma candidum]